jgi:hypothetical protein
VGGMKMLVKFFHNNTQLDQFKCSDISGIIAAAKEADNIAFENNCYKYESMTLKHYHKSGELCQELIIYVKPS